MTRTCLAGVLVALVLVGAFIFSGQLALSSNSSDVSTANRASLTVSAAEAGRTWASETTATLGPGVQTYTADAQCTANFVFIDRAKRVYLGQAAHCAGFADSSSTNGCRSRSRPLGTRVTFNSGGAWSTSGEVVGTGRLAYSSWLTMRRRHEKNHATCAYNDFALVKIDPKYLARVNPSVPFWGGPAGLNTAGTSVGEIVHGYGNSSLRGGDRELSPQAGVVDGDSSATHGWSHEYLSPTPGIPGDSGSAFLDSHGRAVGTLSTFAVSVLIVDAISDIHKELAYARRHSGIQGLKLVLGTSSFGLRS
jgi:hypothetical protein